MKSSRKYKKVVTNEDDAPSLSPSQNGDVIIGDGGSSSSNVSSFSPFEISSGGGNVINRDDDDFVNPVHHDPSMEPPRLLSSFTVGDEDHHEIIEDDIIISDIEEGGGGGSGRAASPSATIASSPLQSSLPPPSSLYGRVYTADVVLETVEAVVVSPADLPEGYKLRVDMGDNRILVAQVPYGGVRKGQTFRAGYRIYTVETEGDLIKRRQRRRRERRKNMKNNANHQQHHHHHHHGWKAGFCGCCEFGLCHPSCIESFLCCCQCILLAQIMTRLNLNWFGRRVSRPVLSRDTITGVFVVFFGYHLIQGIISSLIVLDANKLQTTVEKSNENTGSPTEHQEEEEESEILTISALHLARIIIDILFITYALLILVRTRSAVRDRYFIDGDACADCCASLCCTPCVLSQMARQTADYRDREARWCTDTGLAEAHDREYGLTEPIVAFSMQRSIV